MQAKGLVKIFAILLTLVCIFQLSFTIKSWMIDNNADEYADQQVQTLRTELAHLAEEDPVAYNDTISTEWSRHRQRYIDSITNEPVYNLLVTRYTYDEVRDNQLNLGLDLQGGMSVILQVSIEELLINLAGPNSNDPEFRQTLERAREIHRARAGDYITHFLEAFNEVAPPNSRLSDIFAHRQTHGFIEPDYSNEQISNILRRESREAVDRTYEILRARIDQFGVAAPQITRLEASERIIVELPGVDNPQRVRRLLQSVAELAFWETYKLEEAFDYLIEADNILADILTLDERRDVQEKIDEMEAPENGMEDPDAQFIEENGDTIEVDPFLSPEQDDLMFDEEEDALNPLLSLLHLTDDRAGQAGLFLGSPVVGAVRAQDTATVNRYLAMEEVQRAFPVEMRLLWDRTPDRNTGLFPLYAIRTGVDGRPPLDGSVITSARQDFDQFGNPSVSVTMNREGSIIWHRLTADNVQDFVAIALDDRVVSAPRVQGPIAGGRTEITGRFTIREARDLASALEAGKLPAPAHIVQESHVGPTLGQESIRAGVRSMIGGLALVLVFMMFYYARSGIISTLALIANIFFIFGVLAALGATLTLPGLAGIVLTIGMAVDANVIIFERIREELLRGKSTRLSILDGFKNSYSAIIDANLTTLIIAVILFYFGMGPVLGFATVLIIGILSSLFTAVLLTRVAYDWVISKDKKINFGNKATINAFGNLQFDFLSKRKIAYVISSFIILAGIVSFFVKGFELGVDFMGGRSYEVAFEQPVTTVEVRNALTEHFGGVPPEVKTIGASNQLKITTSYLIDDHQENADSIVSAELLAGIQQFYPQEVSFQQFERNYLRSYHKVEPTIAADIQQTSIWATLFALTGIFLYILFRFRKWQFSVGSIAALTHDVLILLSVYSLLAFALPFSLEINQAFIAALLTVIGYSINDTVIVFDRIREFLNERRKGASYMETVNRAMNATLSRTVITSGTTFMVILILFIFGGDVIRGFAFAILIGILVGTYSSLFIASPIVTDLEKSKDDFQPRSEETKKKVSV